MEDMAGDYGNASRLLNVGDSGLDFVVATAIL